MFADDSDYDFGSGDFTVECYFYDRQSSGYSADPGIVGLWNYSDARRSWLIFKDYSTGKFTVVHSTDGTFNTSNIIDYTPLTYNKWTHVAYVRNGNTLSLYVNGTLAGTKSESGSLYSNTTDSVFIGSIIPTNNFFNGVVSNVRVIKGTALYTSNFTPPSAPLTNVTNTKLLCCQDTTEFRNGALPILNTNATGTTTTSGTIF